MFEKLGNFFNKMKKTEVKELASKDAAKERLHLVLMQDRANVSVDFLELMKQEIIDVIKKYIVVDESAIDVRLTNQDNGDGTTGAPSLYANIPILNIKNDVKAEKIKEGTLTYVNGELGKKSSSSEVIDVVDLSTSFKDDKENINDNSVNNENNSYPTDRNEKNNDEKINNIKLDNENKKVLIAQNDIKYTDTDTNTDTDDNEDDDEEEDDDITFDDLLKKAEEEEIEILKVKKKLDSVILEKGNSNKDNENVSSIQANKDYEKTDYKVNNLISELSKKNENQIDNKNIEDEDIKKYRRKAGKKNW